MTTATINLAKIDAELKTFTTNVETLRGLGHKIAMMIVYHSAPKEASPDCNGTGDCTRALSLMEAMPSSWAEQLHAWMNNFTPIRVNLSGKNVGYDKKYSALTAEEKLTWWKVAEAAATPFYAFQQERPPVFFDYAAMKKMIERLPTQIEKKIKDGLVPDEDLASAKALIATLESITVRKIKPAPAANASDEGAAAPAAAAA